MDSFHDEFCDRLRWKKTIDPANLVRRTFEESNFMSRQTRNARALFLVATLLLTGCHPIQPFYLTGDGSLDHYIDQATTIDYPDVDEEVTPHPTSRSPRTVAHSEIKEYWELPLEEAIHRGLANAEVIRSAGQIRQLGQITNITPDQITNNGQFAPTTYDVALQETDPNSGVAAALSAFDATISTNVFWEKADRPQNVPGRGILGQPSVFQQDTGTFLAELTKQTAPGTVFTLRNNTIYDQNNRGFNRVLMSDWNTNIEFEMTHPLLRGSGTQVNRVPTIIARIRTDISLAQFEGNVRDQVDSIERAYWELHFQYRTFKAAKKGYASALATWQRIEKHRDAGTDKGSASDLAQAGQQLDRFKRAQTTAHADLFTSERRLRQLMGLPPNGRRMIRPANEPTRARVQFEWSEVITEAYARSPELRQQKWLIAQNEQELIVARNQLLPELNLFAMYRVLGAGDDLWEYPRKGLNFPAEGSLAMDELTEGNYTESRIGVSLRSPFGFRRERAGLRNAQIQLAKSKAILRAQKIDIEHQIADAFNRLDNHFLNIHVAFSQWRNAQADVEATEALDQFGQVTTDRLLEAQRNLADAEVNYYNSLLSYNMAISEVHFRKGSLLEYNSVFLAEGPWSGKAYFDAERNARRRSAGTHLDYGYTRPAVVSRGPIDQHQGITNGIKQPALGIPTEEASPTEVDDWKPAKEEQPQLFKDSSAQLEENPTFSDEEFEEEVVSLEPFVSPAANLQAVPQQDDEAATTETVFEVVEEASQTTADFSWGELGLVDTADESEAVVEPVSHEEETETE